MARTSKMAFLSIWVEIWRTLIRREKKQDDANSSQQHQGGDNDTNNLPHETGETIKFETSFRLHSNANGCEEKFPR